MSELQSLTNIFANKIFRIPDYQRGYAWQNPQLIDFWEDIINLRVDRYHYTGMLSIKQLSRTETTKLGNEAHWLLDKGYEAYHIVDGQQRLTTFIIMLNEIIRLVRNLPENKGKSDKDILLDGDSIESICSKYISRKHPDGVVITYIFGYEKDNPSQEYLKHCILGEPYGNTIAESYYTKNMKNAMKFFKTHLNSYYVSKGMNGIEELFHKITVQLKFNVHKIDEDYDVFVAFETMNNRGKKLTNLEILKNRLIYLTTLFPRDSFDKTSEIALRDKINKTWQEIYFQLGRNKNDLLSDDEFLRAHWIMYFNYTRTGGENYMKFLLGKFSHKSVFGNPTEISDDVTDEELPKTVVSETLKPEDINNYVNSLIEVAPYWYYTFYPEENTTLSEEEKLWLDRLNRIGINYFRPIVTASLMANCTPGERIAFLKAVERFIFINFRMASYNSTYLSSEYYAKARRVYKGEMKLTEVTVALEERTNDNEKDAVKTFVSKMNLRFKNGDGFYDWRALRYFLFEYEYSLAVKHKIEKLSWGVLSNVVKDKISIEHILPQTSSTRLYWRNNFRQFSPEEIKILSSSLGNLLPLSQSINSSLQNDSFDDKKARGYTNGCHSEIEVSTETSWNAERIYDRGIRLLKFMENRWNFKFESCDQMDELLHIAFIKDGREIPEEITVAPTVMPVTADKTRSKRIGELMNYFASLKENAGKIHINHNKSNNTRVRFTTDKMSMILPDAPEPTSGWGTNNYYFYEITNSGGGRFINIHLAISSENIPDDLREICDRINSFFPARIQKENWTWRRNFTTKYVAISENMTDADILAILEEQYSVMMECEKKLEALMN